MQRAGNTWSGQILDPPLSSTRAEAFGLYATLATLGPVHVGIDNAGVVRRANLLLQAPGRQRQHRCKPWGLVDDGDVWEAIAAAVHKKGRHAVAVSKVKGHATTSHVAQGDVPAEQKEGNDHADTGAELAHAKQDRWKVDLMPALVARWNHCQQTVAAIQDMMLMIIDATRTRRQQLVETAQLSSTHRKRLVFARPLCAPRGLATLLVRTVTTRLYQPRHASWQLQLQQFLCQSPWVLQTEDAVEQGMTWLELAIAF